VGAEPKEIHRAGEGAALTGVLTKTLNLRAMWLAEWNEQTAVSNTTPWEGKEDRVDFRHSVEGGNYGVQAKYDAASNLSV